MEPNEIAPGWYSDPKNASGYRWWDGEAWTDEVYDQSGSVVATSETEEATISFEGDDQINYTESSSSRAIFFIVVFLVIAALLFIAVAA